jgi:hypothetical protein
VGWNKLAQNNQWQVSVNAKINIWVPEKEKNLFTE